MRRLAFFLGSAFVVLALGAAALVVWAMRASLPRVDGTERVVGLARPVTIVRDRAGVPHVFADSALDAQRGLGFAQAQDRRLQLELSRRFALGRLAEILGDVDAPAPFMAGPVFAFNALELDRQMRSVGLVEVAQVELDRMEPENRALLTAWVEGLNAATDSGAAGAMVAALGVPIEPWTPLDSVAVMKLGALTFAFGGWDEQRTGLLLRELGPRDLPRWLPPYPSHWAPPLFGAGATPAASRQPPALPAVAAVEVAASGAPRRPLGSNNWVVHGRRTTTGMPLLANDPHLDVNPAWMYVAHVSAPGFEAIGTATVGLGFAQGHNDRIAWGVTIVGADAEDLFVEQLAPDDPPRRRTADGWEPLRLRREQIRVRGRTETVEHVVRESSHGPLLRDWTPEDVRSLGPAAVPDARYATAVLWTGGQPGRADAFLDLVRARDWETFRAALRDGSGVPANYVYADVDGHIGYQLAGRIPLREGDAPRVPSFGWERGHEWTGLVPFDALPSLFDPPDGVIVTANAHITGPEYPYYISDEWGDVPLRARRIRELLERPAPLGIDDMTAIQRDVQEDHLRLMARWAALADGSDPAVRGVQEALAAWDRRADPGSHGAALAEAFFLELVHACFADRLSPATFQAYLFAPAGRTLAALERALEDDDATFFGPERETARAARTAAVTRAVRAATARLEQALGPDRAAWEWGRLHTVRFIHTFGQGPAGPWLGWFVNTGPLPAPGSTFTVNAGWWSLARPFEVWVAPMYRQVVDLADVRRSVWTPPPPGAAEHPWSSHFRDQTEPWLAGRQRPMWWTRSQVEADADTTLVLVPG